MTRCRGDQTFWLPLRCRRREGESVEALRSQRLPTQQFHHRRKRGVWSLQVKEKCLVSGEVEEEDIELDLDREIYVTGNAR